MPKSFEKLINKISIQQSNEDATKNIITKLETEKKLIIAFANAHAFNLANTNSIFLGSLLESNILYRDGIGVKIFSKLLKRDAGENLNGTDFIPYLLKGISTGKKIAIFGTKKNTVNAAIPIVESFGGQVVVSEDGFQESSRYVELSCKHQADIYILAMGMPKQEEVAAILRDNIENGVIICGGAIIDFLGGKVKRAPSIFIKLNLEWLYRLLIEPRRMFNRYLIGNFKFLYNALITTLHCK
jgi:exopolysaccharide biosynthesis WecB/TagA/CpsF family protein